MSENGWTKGPWEMLRTVSFDEAACTMVDRDDEVILIAGDPDSDGAFPEEIRVTGANAVPNANLIAASPALAEAMEDVMQWINNWAPAFTHDDEWPETESRVIAALNSAKGRP